MQEANNIIAGTSGYDYTFIMYVMSSTPGWGGVAGVGYVPGEITWYKDTYAVDTSVR